MDFHSNQFERFAVRICLRALKSPRYWHNREYTFSQAIKVDSGYIALSWPGYGGLKGKPLNLIPSLNCSTFRIVASGPSIASISQPDALFDTTTLLVNGASILARDRSAFDYYFVTDPDFLVHNTEAFCIGIKKAKHVVLNYRTAFALMKMGLCDLVSGDIYLRDELFYPFKQNRRGLEELVQDGILHPSSMKSAGFSLKPHVGTFACGTVTYQAIQMAAAMGAKRIEMYGTDLSQGRFYRELNPAPTALEKVFHSSLIPCFRLANQVCKELGCVLVNCSLESRLPDDIVPKVDPNSSLQRML